MLLRPHIEGIWSKGKFLSILAFAFTVAIEILPTNMIFSIRAIDCSLGKADVLRIDSLFGDTRPAHRIFGYDITSYVRQPGIDDELKKLYNRYVRFINSKGVVKKGIPTVEMQSKKKISYLQFNKVKMMADILRLQNRDKDSLSIYTIGSSISRVVSNRQISSKDVDNVINDFYNKEFKHDERKHSRYDKYYDTLDSVVSNYREMNCVLYTYGDCIPDEGTNPIERGHVAIDNRRVGSMNHSSFFSKGAIENLFISPSPQGTSKNGIREPFLKGAKSLRERHIHLNRDINMEDDKGLSVDEIISEDGIEMIHYSDGEASPSLYFPDSTYRIKIDMGKEELPDNVTIMLSPLRGNGEIELSDRTYAKILGEGRYYIKFSGGEISKSIKLNVEQQDSSYRKELFIDLELSQSKVPSMIIRLIVLLFLSISGFGLGVFLHRLINYFM
ncbi:MAG: hypothetical protein LBN29_08110 [Mediterranea sp.]|jgi:hypothetical protein|nr:hypothetical protein [Mediterranea sp.]